MFGTLAFSFTANNGVGACSVPGLKVGDVLVYSAVQFSPPAWGYQPPNSTFETVVSVDDELQQVSSSNLSGASARAIIVRGF